MQTAIGSSISGRVAFRPRITHHRRMAREINCYHSYNVAITFAAALILMVTGLIFYSEQGWMWWFMWADTAAIVVLSSVLIDKIRHSISKEY